MTGKEEEELVCRLFDRLHQTERYELVDVYEKNGINLYDFFNRRTKRRVTVRYDATIGILKPACAGQ